MITARYSFLCIAVAATCSINPAKRVAAQPHPPLSEKLVAEGKPAPAEKVPAAENGMQQGERWASQCRTMTVLSRRVVAESGMRVLELVVRNSGDRSVAPDVSVDVFQTGEEVAQFRTTLRPIPPGRSLRHRIDLSELPPGRYQALTIVQNQDGDISGMRNDLELP